MDIVKIKIKILSKKSVFIVFSGFMDVRVKFSLKKCRPLGSII
jgi:hypothetical protein